ncbi:unnamed protein product [Dovyalis caffra]|uniref:Protein-lysine N-methyltransferase DCAF_LOCUS16661 n=1 Tax=Dovyalis caffra TaxID=77055 RepID=A0AAV1RY20_9ROSI|nr:unnamed protein product [Dovyalis caffra]
MEDEQVEPQVFADHEDDPPVLSSHALAALKEFLQEQQQLITDQTAQTGGEGTETGNRVALVAEDWRLSQFWYDQLTAETVANEVLTLLNNPSSLAACIACPTLFAYIKKIDPSVNVQLLEYDKRFEQYGSDFTFYDYNKPEDLPDEFKHNFQVVVADPPYLSQECLEKVAQAISFLAIPGKSYVLLLTDVETSPDALVSKLQGMIQLWRNLYIATNEQLYNYFDKLRSHFNVHLLDDWKIGNLVDNEEEKETGDVQRDRAAELLGLRSCGFKPQHSSKLGNEFRLFTNYDPGMRLGGWELEK